MDIPYYKYHVFFCTNQRQDSRPCCQDNRAAEMRSYMKQKIKESGHSGKGEIRVNDKKLRPNDFGKFGGFVQQDDILLETFTPEESFRFAAKLRTNLNPYEIEDKIDDIVKRLSLQNCRNTRIGG